MSANVFHSGRKEGRRSKNDLISTEHTNIVFSLNFYQHNVLKKAKNADELLYSLLARVVCLTVGGFDSAAVMPCKWN